MRYLIEDVGMGVFLASAVALAVAIILYSLHGLWRLTLDGPCVHDASRAAVCDDVEKAEAQAAYDVVEEAELVVEHYLLGKERDNV